MDPEVLSMQIHFLLEARRTNVIPAAKFAGCLVNKKEHIQLYTLYMYIIQRTKKRFLWKHSLKEKSWLELFHICLWWVPEDVYHCLPLSTIPYHNIPLSTIPYHTIPCYTTSGEGSRGMSTKGKRQRWHSGVTFAQGGKEIPSQRQKLLYWTQFQEQRIFRMLCNTFYIFSTTLKTCCAHDF